MQLAPVEGSSCPFSKPQSSDKETVRARVRLAKEDEIIANTRGCCTSFWGNIATLPQRISNCVLFARNGEITPVIKQSIEHEEKAKRHAFVVDVPVVFPNPDSSLPSPVTFYGTANSAVTKAFLNQARYGSEENSFFTIPDQYNAFLKVFQILFPDETVQEEDNVLTCQSDQVRQYRDVFSKELSQKSVETPQMKGYLKGLIKNLMGTIQKQESGTSINAAKMMDIFASSVISKLLLGNDGPFEELTEAVDIVLEDVNNQFIPRSLSEEQKKKIAAAYQMLREAVEKSLESDSVFVKGLGESLSQTQIKTTLALLYLAGQGTSSILMTRCLWELGRHPEYQAQILKEINGTPEFVEYFKALDRGEDPEVPEGLDNLESVRKLMEESLRLSTPAFNICRVTKNPLMVKVTRLREEIFSKYIPENSLVFFLNNLAAQNPQHFPQPQECHPDRFAGNNSLTVPVFGGGLHICPGRFLTQKEVMLLLPHIMWRFVLKSSKESIKLKEAVTLSYAEPVLMTFTPREQ